MCRKSMHTLLHKFWTVPRNPKWLPLDNHPVPLFSNSKATFLSYYLGKKRGAGHTYCYPTKFNVIGYTLYIYKHTDGNDIQTKIFPSSLDHRWSRTSDFCAREMLLVTSLKRVTDERTNGHNVEQNMPNRRNYSKTNKALFSWQPLIHNSNSVLNFTKFYIFEFKMSILT